MTGIFRQDFQDSAGLTGCITPNQVNKGFPSRPILRYHGGKWMLAPWIVSHFPAHRVYVEAFAGGASVLLRKPRSHAEVYNDLDHEVVNVFRVVRDRGVELINAIDLTPYSREEYEAACGAMDPDLGDVERARRTIVRSFMGFSSASTTNATTGFRARNGFQGGSSVGTHWRNYPEGIVEYIERLRGVVIENRSAIETIEAHDSPKTLHYIDPPYVLGTRDRGADYRHELSDDDHRHLAEILSRVRGMVILSGYRSELYAELFGHWRQIDRSARADGQVARVETLWLSPNIEGGLL